MERIEVASVEGRIRGLADIEAEVATSVLRGLSGTFSVLLDVELRCWMLDSKLQDRGSVETIPASSAARRICLADRPQTLLHVSVRVRLKTIPIAEENFVQRPGYPRLVHFRRFGTIANLHYLQYSDYPPIVIEHLQAACGAF